MIKYIVYFNVYASDIEYEKEIIKEFEQLADAQKEFKKRKKDMLVKKLNKNQRSYLSLKKLNTDTNESKVLNNYLCDTIFYLTDAEEEGVIEMIKYIVYFNLYARDIEYEERIIKEFEQLADAQKEFKKRKKDMLARELNENERSYLSLKKLNTDTNESKILNNYLYDTNFYSKAAEEEDVEDDEI